MPYHVHITLRAKRATGFLDSETKLDLSLDELEKRVLAPHQAENPIVLGGRAMPLETIERIKITYSDQPGAPQLQAYGAERQSKGLMSNIFVADAAYFADRQKDMTDEFITGPPGNAAHVTAEGAAAPSGGDPRQVFLVYGRDQGARDAMAEFLRALNLQPVEWIQAVKATGKSSPYIGEILDAGMSMAQAVAVLLTPDDQVRLREELWGTHESAHEKEFGLQARPNVLYEAGLAMGKYPNRIVLVELGDLRPFSDIGGIHTIRGLDSLAKRQGLAQRLQTAGCVIDLDGTDWHTAGDFRIRL